MIRFLDPSTAPVSSGTQPGSTAYASDRLLVRRRRDDTKAATGPDVDATLKDLGWTLADDQAARTAVRATGEQRERRVRRRRLSGPSGTVTTPPDAWLALEHIRQASPDRASDYGLDHVMTATTLTGVGGYWGGIGGYWGGIGGYWGGIGGYWGGIAASPEAEYGIPGAGGRSPVSLVIADPATSVTGRGRRPVVVMPDTGIGPHPWFAAEATPAAQPFAARHPDVTGDAPGANDEGRLTGTMRRLDGHGTFIAGIIRQSCPSARLVAPAVMSSDGLLMESELIDLLEDLIDQQRAAIEKKDASSIVDIVTLSAGYYHESPADDVSDGILAQVLRDLGSLGVIVVAAAGNDATTRPLMPAAFAELPPRHDTLPVVSVGSLNPNDSVSLFSNAGPWVTTYRHGAAIVSTLPTTLNAGGQARTVGRQPQGDSRPRSTIDLDDYAGGFGVWSGTSFAAPVLAGQLASALVTLGTGTITAEAMVNRGWKAIETVVKDVKRP